MLSSTITARLRPQVLRIGRSPIFRRSYADAPQSRGSSKFIPWFLAWTVLGAGGYYYFVSSEKKQQIKDNVVEKKQQIQEGVHHAKERTKEQIAAHKQELELDKSRLPKPNPDKDSEAGHATASHNNEHKVRHGIFHAGDFDNHDTKHTADPSKDFEAIVKSKEK